jgi:two-component system chemotaxis sensor kinase CheA
MSIDLEMVEILKVFFQESTEGLDAMESGLLNLDASADRETIDTIFRAAHSIKGGAGMFGLMQIAEFTHGVETLLDQMRDRRRPVTTDAVQVLLQAVDVMREMLTLAESEQPIVSRNADALTRKLEAILADKLPTAAGPTGAAEPVAAPLAEGGSARWRIEFWPHASLFKTCNDPLRIFNQLATLGTLEVEAHLNELPTFNELDPSDCHLGWTLILSGSVQRPQIMEIFDWVDANSSVEVELEPAAAEKVQPRPEATPEKVAPATIAPAARPVEARPAAASPSKVNPEAGSIRVATEKVDALINLVGELIITQSMLNGFSERCDPTDMESLRRGLTHLARHTRELQESVLKIRMLPISFSFNRIPRLVHELSRKLGKKVELKIIGEHTELDKTVLEKIGDPLVHLVRNSLDHGLETPEVRLAAGKRDTGTLEISAAHEGGSIVIEVKDDGAGLNKERILAKARERGLIGADAVLTDEQIHNLIFLPGFSTAAAVSDVSGRGVGMDVVRSNIADLGGQVHLLSTPGNGSTIRIRLPLTLSILEGQMLRVGREIYVISLLSIVETVQPMRDRIQSIGGKAELFRHRDEYLPIIRLHELFAIEPDSTAIASGLLVICESDGRRVAILVDELMAQQQVVIKSLETNFGSVQGLAGATIHGDGTVALILDVPSLIDKFLASNLRSIEWAA